MRVLILQGGYNEEHKVSINTAKQIGRALSKLKIEYKNFNVNPNTFEKDILKYSNKYICFNALHGSFGEDGAIQKILKKNKFRFTHSNQISSISCFDKVKSKKIVNKFKIKTPIFEIINCKKINSNFLLSIKKKYSKFVLKPVKSGSSYGLRIIKTKSDLNIFLKDLTKYKKKFDPNEKFLIEKFIQGIELTVSVFEQNSKPKSLAVTEIVSFNSSYDYQAKYSKGFSKHFIPARISQKNYKKCLSLALKIHKIFKCNTISRIDFIFSKKQDKIYFLEINSQPGMTRLSLLPEQAEYQNIAFENIILKLLYNAK